MWISTSQLGALRGGTPSVRPRSRCSEVPLPDVPFLQGAHARVHGVLREAVWTGNSALELSGTINRTWGRRVTLRDAVPRRLASLCSPRA